jgi:hypothetical protein
VIKQKKKRKEKKKKLKKIKKIQVEYSLGLLLAGGINQSKFLPFPQVVSQVI